MSKASGELALPETITIPLFRLDGLIAFATFAFIALISFFSIGQLQAPPVVAADAPPAVFAAGRALPHVARIAQQPHPMGVPAHAQVRDYIVRQMRDLGLSVEVQRTTSVNSRSRAPFMAGTVQNIVARLEGTANTKAILLVAHYDSALNSPGAGDDGAGVAALIETARALTASGPLRNDVVFLFTDGEESWLLGSKAFAEEHPLAPNVGLVVNLEARGAGGPVFMFQTSPQNGWLIREFAQAAPYPFASSVFNDLYRFLPNDTDFTELGLRGLRGFNLAFIDSYLRYHTSEDSFENLDPQSLQHHGSYALALARHFGNLNLQNTQARDAVYFNILGSWFVYYSSIWTIPLALLVTLAYVGVLRLGLRRRQLTLRGVGLGTLAFLATLLIVSGVVALVWSLINRLHPEYRTFPHGEPYNSYMYLLGFVALAIGITSALYGWFHNKISIANLTFGGLTWWLILTLGTSLFLPGSSYLFALPLLFSLLGVALALNTAQPSGGFTRRFLPFLLCAVPSLLLFPPLIYLIFISLTMRLAPVVLAVVVLLLGALIPHLQIMALPRRWLLPSLALLVGVGLLTAGSLMSGFDADQPKPNDMMYALDTDTGQAVIASAELVQDSWTAQFFQAESKQERLERFFPVSPRPLRQAQAPVLPFAAPNVTLLDDQTAADLRTVRLRLDVPQDVQLAFVWVDANTEVVGSLVDGKRVANNRPTRAGDPWGMIYWAPPREGIELTLEVRPGQPLRVRVVDRIAGFPELPGASFTPRPPEMMPPPALGTVSQYSDAALVLKSFVFEPPQSAAQSR